MGLLGATGWAAEPAANAAPRALYETLAHNGLLEKRYDPVIRPVLGTLLAAIHHAAALNLNGPYSGSSVNVYVVGLSGQQLDPSRIGNPQVRLTLEALRDNAVALPPDIVLLDSRFLEHLVLNAWNQEMGVMLALNEKDARVAIGTPQEEAEQVIALYGAIADLYRFGNIRAWRSASTASGEQSDVRRVSDSLSANGASDMLLFALAPIFYHELGHLEQGTAGAYLEFVQEIAQYFASRRLLAIEDAADQYAASALRQLVLQRHRQRVARADSDLKDYESMAATVMLMRDSVLFDVFDGFRGLPVEDQFLGFVHQDCRRHPETAQLGFYESGKLASASRAYRPVLTAKELATLHTKFVKSAGSGSHAHAFIRGERITEALQELFPENERADNFMSWYVGFLKVMRAGDPVPLQLPDFLYARVDTGYLARLSRVAGIDWQPAVTCPANRCFVGTFHDGRPGFAELSGATLRLVWPLWGDHPAQALASENADARERGLRLLLKIVGDLVNDPAAVQAALDPERLIGMARKCGSVDLSFIANGTPVSLGTLNPQLWVSLLVTRPAIDWEARKSAQPTGSGH
jgi:hypothetical protein